ncbi:MAG: SoxR reducing system RseC family protein [Bacillota bacterium]
MQSAVVLEPGPLATVMITRSTTCRHCGMCHSGARPHMVRAVDLVGARQGQQVLIEFSERTFLLAALLSFGVPLAGLLVGILAGGAAGGLAGLAGAYVVLHLLDRKLLRFARPVIVAICPHTGGTQ